MPFLYFFDSYFFSLMMYRSPIEFGVRIIDIFLLEGEGLFNFMKYDRHHIRNFIENAIF
jgi:hypothetical protein